MSENAVPFLDLAKLQDARLADRRMDAARLLISPPPEEELQRTHIFGASRTNNTPAVPKRKRPGVASTPSRTDQGEATPNPKPRKAHRKRTDSSQQDSPTRPAFPRQSTTLQSPHALNPDADFVPPELLSAGRRRRSATPQLVPYEPPRDVFTPPREVVLQTPTAQSKPRRRPSVSASVSQSARARTPQPVHARTPIRVVVHSVKKEPPAIDLARPMTPPSPSDDPLLLVASSSPIKRHHARNAASPSSDYAPFDWTAHAAPPQDGSTDSMDVEPDAEVEAYDGPLPAVLSAWDAPAGAWDSDDDEEGELPSVPTATASASLPGPSYTSRSHSHTTPPRAGRTSPYTEYTVPTKRDPPTPGTRARAAAWGVWGSPFPGAAVGEGSFRMDGRKRNASFNADGDGVDGERGGMEHGVGAGGMQDGEEEEEEEDEDMHDILRGVREEHQEEEEEEVRAMSVEDDEEQECSREGEEFEEEQPEQQRKDEDNQQDQDEEEEEEEEEVRRMSIEPEPAPRFVVHAPNLISTAPVSNVNNDAHTPAPRFPLTQTQHPALTPPARRAPTVPARSERQLPRPSFASGYSQTHPDADRGQDAWDAEQREEVDEDDEEEQTHVLAGVGERVDSRALLRAAQLDRALIDADADADAEVEVDADGDGASDSDDGGVLGLVKITSADPRAAARAAAILKQHDYDCFTKLRLQRERAKKRHSLAGGVGKSPARGTAPSWATPARSDRERKERRERKARRQTISVVGEQVYFPGSPKPVTMAQLLAEAEREVGAASPPRKDAGMSLSTPLGTGDAYTTPVRASTHSHSHFNFDSASAPFTPAPPLRVGGLVERRPSSGLAREVVLSDDEGQDEDATGQGQDGETGGQRAWTKDDWKALDACFTDERIALVASKASSNAEADAVELAPADVVDVHAVVRRFVRMMGGERAVAQYGDAWGVETLTQRAMALQSKQRAGMVAPPTPRASSTSSPSFASASTTRAPDDDSVFATHKRRPSMEAPDLTPLGRRARKPRLPAPLGTDAPFANLAPEPERRRRLPASLLAPRYSHLLEEAVSVSQGAPPPAEEEPDADVDSSFASSTSASTGGEDEHEEENDHSREDEHDHSREVEMPPATPLREKEERAAQRPASLGRRVTGFLFSYLPTLSKTAPPPTRRPAGPARPGLPLPPLDILEKPRGPINTPVRPPLPRTRPPKELVTLQPAPAPPKPPTRIPRAAPPKRLVELQHVVAPEASVRVGPRPRTSSGGSVKDLVKNFEALDGARKRAPEVKRVRSVGEFGNGSKKPMWRP